MPLYTRTFENYRPPRRYDSEPYTVARIEESALPTSGFAALEEIVLAPVDADPADPQVRNLTTDQATLEAAWYRIVWVDADDAEYTGEAVYFSTVTPNAGDLTSLGAMRLYLQKPAADTEQDEIIEQLITRASAAITRHCDREFVPTPGVERVLLYEPNERGYLSLAPYDLRTATQVQIDTDNGSPTEIEAADYRLYPRGGPDGVYTYMRLYVRTGTSSVWGDEREVTITGDWGFEAVPADVEQACIETVGLVLRRDVAGMETTFSIDEDRLERPMVIPAKALGALRRFERQAYV